VNRKSWFTILLAVLLVAWHGPSPAGASSSREAVSFTDLEGHWARSHITRLAALDVVVGYPDHTYKPEQLVSRLETVTLVIRSGGFTAEAEKLASCRAKVVKTRPGAGSKINLNIAGPAPTPRVPWGQAYLDLAVEKGFLPLDKPEDYDYNGPATRLEVARLLAHALYLVPPASKTGASPAENGSPGGAGLAAVKAFSDEAGLSQDDLACVRAVAAAGVMSGYPDGTFRPQEPLTRAEMAAVLSRLVDRGWVKVPAGRRLAGWISGVGDKKGSLEIELTSLSGVQKLKVAGGALCYQEGEERPLEQSANFRCEVVLNGSRQAAWVNLLEQKSGETKMEKTRGSVKSVALGEDNLLVINDLNCQDLILPLAWDAVVTGKKAGQGFKSLKPGDFVDVETALGQVRKATVLEVKTVSGKVDRINGGCLYFDKGPTGDRPGWFRYYDRARIVDKDGMRRGDVFVGEQVQVTYLDPVKGEIDDEIALEIKVTN
jgi:hypothetical protein